MESVDLSDNPHLLLAAGEYSVDECLDTIKSLIKLKTLNLTNAGVDDSKVAVAVVGTAVETLYVTVGMDKTLMPLKRGDTSLDLREATLCASDLILVGAWIHHCQKHLTNVDLSGNSDLVSVSSTMDAAEVSEGWKSFCSSVGATLVESLGLADCNLASNHLHDLSKTLGHYGLLDATLKLDEALNAVLAVLSQKDAKDIIDTALDKLYLTEHKEVILVATCDLIDPHGLTGDEYKIEDPQELASCLEDRRRKAKAAQGKGFEGQDETFAKALTGEQTVTSQELAKRLSDVDKSKSEHGLAVLMNRAEYLRSWLKQKPDGALCVPLCEWLIAMAEYGEALTSVNQQKSTYGENTIGPSLKRLDLHGNALVDSIPEVDETAGLRGESAMLAVDPTSSSLSTAGDLEDIKRKVKEALDREKAGRASSRRRDDNARWLWASGAWNGSDGKWKPFGQVVIDVLEGAWAEGEAEQSIYPQQSMLDGTEGPEYIVDMIQMIQFQASDRSRQRRVRRDGAEQEPEAEAEREAESEEGIPPAAATAGR